MQLFVTPFTIQGESVVIENSAVLEQLTKVLRVKRGDRIGVQSLEFRAQNLEFSNNTLSPRFLDSASLHSKGQEMKRYIITIDDWDRTKIYGTVVERIAAPIFDDRSVVLYVAMPNKRDKAELIAQKCAEIGVLKLVFWRAERSVLREINDKKVIRIQKIMQEAVEQSWGWYVPELLFVTEGNWDITENVVIFDKIELQDVSQSKGRVNSKLQVSSPLRLPDESRTGRHLPLAGEDSVKEENKAKVVGVVGPEGGLTQVDYVHFPHHIVYSLGNTILRMETAVIVGAWVLQNRK